jgi:hypothetical protein
MQKSLIPVSVQTVPNYKLLSCDVKFWEEEEKKNWEAQGVSSK